MAETKNTRKGDSGTTRRGFIGAIGAAAAASALPAGAAAVPAPATWHEAVGAWPEAQAQLIAQFRALYLAEVRRCAEALRPRLESRELHGLGDDIDDDQSALNALEAACAEHFGIAVRKVKDEDGHTLEHVGDEATARVIIAVSPSAEHHEPEGGWDHPGYCAKACISWDVLAVATALGFYKPLPDECPGPESTAWAREVVS